MGVRLMDELPVELKGEIISHLDLFSLLQIRLVSRHLKEVSLPALKSSFQTVRATFPDFGLQRLREISQNQDLAKCVEHLHIVLSSRNSRASSLDQWSTQQEWSTQHAQEEKTDRKISMLTLAISKLETCYSVGTETQSTGTIGAPYNSLIPRLSPLVLLIMKSRV